MTKKELSWYSTIMLCCGVGFFMEGPVNELYDYYGWKVKEDLKKLDELK